MKDKIVEAQKILYFTMTLLGLILLIFSFYITIKDFINVNNSIYISTKIASLDGNSNAQVKYTVDNVDYETTIKLPKDDTTYAVNDTIKVRVSIKNPNILVNKHYLLSIPTFIIGFILLCISMKMTIQNLQRTIKINKLKKNGYCITCQIASIFMNNNAKPRKGLLPYRLRCSYLNPQNNQLYSFESDDTFININEVITKYNSNSVIVYLDKVNTNNYYVDLNTLKPQIKVVDPYQFMKEQAELAQKQLEKENQPTESAEQSAEQLDDSSKTEDATKNKTNN